MAHNLRKSKGRNPVRLHVQMYRDVIDSPQYAALSPRAVKLLLDVYAQFRGYNNGDLSAALSLMKPRGWSSKDQLKKAIDELLTAQFLGISRRPRARREPILYFLTFLAIDECDGKHDVSSTRVAANEWRQIIAPQHGRDCPVARGNKAHIAIKTTEIVPIDSAKRGIKTVSLPRSTGTFLDIPSGHHLLEASHG
jgi:hypothetical protein